MKDMENFVCYIVVHFLFRTFVLASAFEDLSIFLFIPSSSASFKEYHISISD